MVTIYGKNGTTGLLIIKSFGFGFGFGFASICLFFSLRSINVYGDQAWLIMPTSIETIMSFMKLTKYPPSLLIILFNVDLGVVLLVLLQKVESKNWIKPLIVFGSVPMFFYIAHLYVLKALYLVAVTLFDTPYGEYLGISRFRLYGIFLSL